MAPPMIFPETLLRLKWLLILELKVVKDFVPSPSSMVKDTANMALIEAANNKDCSPFLYGNETRESQHFYRHGL